MNVLVMMEFSGRVRDAFAARGHTAVSCDLIKSETRGYHSTLHWWEFLERYPRWDLMIAHPPCTYLTAAGARWLYHPEDRELPAEQRRRHPKYPYRDIDRHLARAVVEELWKYPCPRICIENPIGALSRVSELGKPTQIIQPWMFGDNESKATCLWLKGLPKLVPEITVEPPGVSESVHRASQTADRWKERSRTFPGIARAFAEQWSNDERASDSIRRAA